MRNKNKKISLIFIVSFIFLFICFKITQAVEDKQFEIIEEKKVEVQEQVVDKPLIQDSKLQINFDNQNEKVDKKENIDLKSEIKEINPVIITELLPNSENESQEEFIELFNQSNQDINLFNWKLRDVYGAIKTYVFPEQTEIKAKSFLVIYRKDISPKIILNNDKDSIELLNNQNEVIFFTPVYFDAPKNKSFSKIENSEQWEWQDLTPKKANNKLDVINQENIENKKIVISEIQNIEIKNAETQNSETKNLILSAISQTTIGVVINEFISDPLPKEKEWIELYNFTDQDIDINNWTIEEGTKAKTILTGVIKSKDFYVIDDPKGSLNNDGDIIVLKNKDGIVIDQVAYEKWNDGNIFDNAIQVKQGQSLVRFTDGVDTNIDRNDFQTTITLTKGRSNLIEKEKIIPVVTGNYFNPTSNFSINQNIVGTKYSDQIIINEILPDPKSNDLDEWIELKNQSDQDVNLSNWIIFDSKGDSKKYFIPINSVILKQNFLVFKKAQTQIVLNNDEDEIKLFNPNNQLVSNVFYEKAKSGQSYSQFENKKWEWTETLTPNQENIKTLKQENNETKNQDDSGHKSEIKNLKSEINDLKTEIINLKSKIQEDPIKLEIAKSKSEIQNLESKNILSVSLKEIRKLEKGTKIKTQGVVSCVPGILGSQIFYLAGSGIQVYLYNKDFPELNLGDEIEISGELSSFENEARIKLSSKNDIKILKKNQPINREEIKVDKINKNTEGYLVKIKGEITETSGNTFYVTDETNEEIKIYIKESTNIKKPKMKEGDQVEITGIVSQTESGYRILPRFQDDILINSKVKMQNEKQNKKQELEIKNQELKHKSQILITNVQSNPNNLNSKINTNIKTKKQEEKSKTKEATAAVGVGSSAVLAAAYRKQIFLFLSNLFLKK